MRFVNILRGGLVLVFLTGTVTLAQTVVEPVEIAFVNDAAMGIPVQDVYIDAALIVRPQGEFTDEMLAQPLYRSTERLDADMEEPFDVGPFPMGEPIGITLGEWLAASGSGTYTVDGDRATLNLTFENLVPNGLYTLWCVEIAGSSMVDAPCGAADGSDSVFTADEDGHGSWMLEIDAFPPSTEDTFYSVALAYHSDGQTYGERPGDFGLNVHVPMWFDFMPEHNDLNPVDMEFINEIALGAPIQDVYIDAGLVVRPYGEMTEEMLAQPLYGTAERTEADFDGLFGITPEFNVGPFERGEVLGFTLGDWLAGTGTGTYTVNGERATLDLMFEDLIPNGLYTLWCLRITFPPDFAIVEAPCGAADGSENEFIADAEGNATITVEIDAFPPSTDSSISEVALAYHSDGKTYGAMAGDFGKNVHVQMVYDFLPPGS